MKNTIITFAIFATLVLTGTTNVNAGTLYPTTTPGESMYSLEEIYELITSSTTASDASGEFPSYTTNPIGGSMRTLTEIYNAVLALRNSNLIVEDEDDDNDDITPPPPPVEDLNNHDNILVTKYWAVGHPMFVFSLFIEAVDKDLYIKKDINSDYILFDDQLAKNVFDSVDPEYPIESNSSLILVDGYYKVQEGQTISIVEQVKIKNSSSTLTSFDIALDKLDYKVATTSAGLRTLDLDQNIFKTNN